MKLASGLVFLRASIGTLISTPSHLSRVGLFLLCLVSAKSYSHLFAYIKDSSEFMCLY